MPNGLPKGFTVCLLLSVIKEHHHQSETKLDLLDFISSITSTVDSTGRLQPLEGVNELFV